MAWYSKRNRVIFLVALGIVLVAGRAFQLYVFPPVLEMFDATAGRAKTADTQATGSINITRPHMLEWRARSGVPALHLRLPPVAFGAWRRSALPSIAQTADGPVLIDLEVVAPGTQASAPAEACGAAALDAGQCGFGHARLRMYRDNSYHSDLRKVIDGTHTLDELYRDGTLREGNTHWLMGMWVEEDAAGAWRFQGWDCAHVTPVMRVGPKPRPVNAPGSANTEPGDIGTAGAAAEAPFFSNDRCFKAAGRLAQWLPSWHGLKRQNLYVGCVEEGTSGCIAGFYFRGRLVDLNFSDARSPALFAAMAQLTQWAADAASPPPPEEQLKRAQQALGHCEAAARLLGTFPRDGQNPSARSALDGAVKSHCGYAVHFARDMPAAPDASTTPAPATGIIIRAMNTPGYDRTLWDRFYAADLLKALTQTGQGESEAMIEAHRIMMRALQVEEDQQKTSLAALLKLTPKVLAADKPLFARVEEELGFVVRSKYPAALPDLAAFRAAWLEKAERELGTESDLVLWIRRNNCVALMYANQERATLNLCADRLFDAWQKRGPAAPGAALAGIPLEHFSVELAQLYLSYAYASADFPNALIQIRKLQGFARSQLEGPRYVAALAKIDEIERNLADKAQESNTSARRPGL